VVATLLDDGSWEVQGRRLTLPVRITDASAALTTYLVRTSAATELVAGTGLSLVSVAGRTPLVLAFITYRAGDLGSYHEVAVALLGRHRRRIGPYIHQMAVTQTFTLEAGRALWGLPKWLARAELDITGPAATCRLSDSSGAPVLTAALRTVPWRIPLTVPGALTALAPHADTVLASRLRGRIGGLRLGLRGATVELTPGHPMADELRALGLPRPPLATLTAEHIEFDMAAAVPTPR
jgi:hypothetical protein